jgi:hypothetical protein
MKRMAPGYLAFAKILLKASVKATARKYGGAHEKGGIMLGLTHQGFQMLAFHLRDGAIDTSNYMTASAAVND